MGASAMEVVSADGFRIPVTEQGHGRPILIVHGGGGPSTSWARVAGHLATLLLRLAVDGR